MSTTNKNKRVTGAEVAARSSRRENAAPQLHPPLSSGAVGATSYRQLDLDGVMARQAYDSALPPAFAPPATAAPRAHTYAPSGQYKPCAHTNNACLSTGAIPSTLNHNLRLHVRHRITEAAFNSWTNLSSAMVPQQCLLRYRPTATWPPMASVWNRTNIGWSRAHSTCMAGTGCVKRWHELAHPQGGDGEALDGCTEAEHSSGENKLGASGGGSHRKE